jgi:hypothetical protein
MSQDDYIEKICRIGQGELCCRYLVIAHTGFKCMKADKHSKAIIDHAWSTTVHVAQGDNCPGKDPIPMTVDENH